MIEHESRSKIMLETSGIEIGIIRTPISANLYGSELQTQRYQDQLNPSPNESKSRTRSAVVRFKMQFGRIERLDETSPTSPRSQKSDISKSENRPSNHSRSRGSISAVRS
ncbi:hypothetical protein M5K25_019681 [Dendrobium thyrsiflorum]|uniref:Uncharacterized protein n=1 Tax=Dendrobium thyrsiflorum TaxID=117978 RepID=A0ABD0UMS3_DENTH